MTKINKQAPNVKISSYYTNRDNMHHALAANEVNFAVDPFPPSETDVMKELIEEGLKISPKDYINAINEQNYFINSMDEIMKKHMDKWFNSWRGLDFDFFPERGPFL